MSENSIACAEMGAYNVSYRGWRSIAQRNQYVESLRDLGNAHRCAAQSRACSQMGTDKTGERRVDRRARRDKLAPLSLQPKGFGRQATEALCFSKGVARAPKAGARQSGSCEPRRLIYPTRARLFIRSVGEPGRPRWPHTPEIIGPNPIAATSLPPRSSSRPACPLAVTNCDLGRAPIQRGANEC